MSKSSSGKSKSSSSKGKEKEVSKKSSSSSKKGGDLVSRTIDSINSDKVLKFFSCNFI
jgi:hypothetical protein